MLSLILCLLLSMPITVLAGLYDPWVKFPSPTDRLLESVHLSDSNLGYAVGDGKIVLKWDGNSWSIVTIPDSVVSVYTTLTDVFCLSENDVWVVGFEYSPRSIGIILHWDGSAWHLVHSIQSNWLYSIYMVSANDGWVVGGNGTILRWNGVSWSSVSSPTSAHLKSVHMLSLSDGWAVGEHEKDNPMLGAVTLHWDGSTWTKHYISLASFLNSVFMVSSNDVWAVGSVSIYHWDGTTWEQSSFLWPAYSVNLQEIYMVSNNDGWIVGGYEPHIFHWDGSTPTPVWSIEPLGRHGMLFGLHMVSSKDGWAVGHSGFIFRHFITDNDGDGMSDDWEKENGLDPNNPNDRNSDPDGDGLSNFREFVVGSNPRNPDTDGDGISDGAEVNAGSNPLAAPSMVGGYIVYPTSIANVEVQQKLIQFAPYLTAVVVLGTLYKLLRKKKG